MTTRTLTFLFILFSITICGQINFKFDSTQINCDDLLLNKDCQLIYNNKPFDGSCNYYSKKHVIKSKSYFTYGLLDSIKYLDKNANVELVEIYQNDMLNGPSRSYYKNGFLKESTTFSNDTIFGMWRKYYKNGQIKYEADWLKDYTIKNNTYYRWTKKGIKYMYADEEVDHSKKFGKLLFESGRTKRKKTLIKNAA